MSDDYRTILVDEFNWAYAGKSKAFVVRELVEAGFTVESGSLYGLLIIESRWHPGLSLKRLVDDDAIMYDNAYFQRLGDASLDRLDL
jgi:hypothetical protein